MPLVWPIRTDNLHTAGAAQRKPTCNWAESHPLGGTVARPCQLCHRRSTIKLYHISAIFKSAMYGGSETAETGALTDDSTRQIDGLRVGPDDSHGAAPGSVASHSA